MDFLRRIFIYTEWQHRWLLLTPLLYFLPCGFIRWCDHISSGFNINAEFQAYRGLTGHHNTETLPKQCETAEQNKWKQWCDVCSVDCVVPVAAITKSEDIFSLINANVFQYSVKVPKHEICKIWGTIVFFFYSNPRGTFANKKKVKKEPLLYKTFHNGWFTWVQE
jgi:hypothetical protein